MIVEAFLTGALALSPAAAFHHGFNNGPVRRAENAFFSEFYGQTHARVLVVGGNPDLIAEFLVGRVKAWGMYDKPQHNVRGQVLGRPERMPFMASVFTAVFWCLAPAPQSDIWLQEVIPVLVRDGYLIFDPGLYHDWAVTLANFGWHQLPVRFGSFHIWTKHPA